MTVFILAAAVLGLMVGSFLNVCISRLPAGESVVSPASHCRQCGQPIRWFDNMPLLSYAWLHGRCRVCGKRIGLRYPLVELGTAVALVAQAATFGGEAVLLLQRVVLTGLLVVLFGTDLETERLPNVITLPGIVAGLLFSLAVPPGFTACIIGAVVGGSGLWLIRWGWKTITGVDGMGLGDVKMLAMIGAFLGWQQVWVVLLFASVSGAIVGVGFAASGRRSLQTRLPFGTFLAIAAFAASLVGGRLVTWYAAFF